ncbi:MAG TPA: DUF3857 and transglutaminase domain-containing protein [Gemmatimonadales bacterium]|jgi:transglutaminase-like putative cysteine protease
MGLLLTGRPADAPGLQAEAPYVIDTLLTRYDVQSDGSVRRTEQVRVRMLSQPGIHFFGQLAFPYDSGYERLEIDYVRVLKPDGRTLQVSAADMRSRSAPIAIEAPIYSDMRELHVTVPGVEVGDVVTYRTVTSSTRPSAPGQVWMEYTFNTTEAVETEILILDVDAEYQLLVGGGDREASVEVIDGRRIYRWINHGSPQAPPDDGTFHLAPPPDVWATTFATWNEVGGWFSGLVEGRDSATSAIREKARALTRGLSSPREKLAALYDYVAGEFRYVALALGVGRYQPHFAADVLANGYGDCKDKHTLLSAMLASVGIRATPVLVNSWRAVTDEIPSPGQFNHVITRVEVDGDVYWLDTTTEVAPLGFLTANLRGARGLAVAAGGGTIVAIPVDPPFPNEYRFELHGELNAAGRLTAHVHQEYRGDTEIVLRSVLRRASNEEREAFAHQWGDILGFRGRAENVTTSDPSATRDPLSIDFDLDVADWADWTGPGATLAAPLPQLNLPAGLASGDSTAFGIATVIELSASVDLPANIRASEPASIAMSRDYAEYASTYEVKGRRVAAARSLRLKAHQLGNEWGDDYAAYRRALLADAAQRFAVERSGRSGVTGVRKETDVEALFDMGFDAVERRDYTSAVPALRRVVELAPDH